MDSYYIKHIPSKLLLITTGNIKNKQLYNLLHTNMEQIISLLKQFNFVEVDNTDIIGHE